MQRLEELFYWIAEREKVRVLKEAGGPKPWSRDWVFQQTYFCNVRREDDRVTRWIRSNWNVQHDNYEFAMCVARLLNYPPSLETIGFPGDGWSVGEAIAALREKSMVGEKVWGNAYVVTTHGQKMDKLTYLHGVLSRMIKTPLNDYIFAANTLANAHKILSAYEGFGSFMAAQVVADLKNTAWHHLADAPDWYTFSAHGPGSLRGLTWVYGEKMTERNYKEKIDALHRVVLEKHELCQQDLQNCLCEFDKYMRVKTGTGRSKRKYNGS